MFCCLLYLLSLKLAHLSSWGTILQSSFFEMSNSSHKSSKKHFTSFKSSIITSDTVQYQKIIKKFAYKFFPITSLN